MANAHNCMIRGINAIYQQAPHVHSTQDKSDLLFFVYAWSRWVIEHHDMEEKVMFPGFEEAAGKPGILSANVDQHAAFEAGLLHLHKYASIKPEQFSADELRSRIEAFQGVLQQHLNDEVQTLLALRPYDSERLADAFDRGERYARDKSKEGKEAIFPIVMGMRDVTYEGGNNWPGIPPHALEDIDKNIWPAHAGAWRFLPSDVNGKPKSSSFLA
ncbi:MAG: hypothetical protein Q9162_002995 [Coniocarpon cinnabarinum]